MSSRASLLAQLELVGAKRKPTDGRPWAWLIDDTTHPFAPTGSFFSVLGAAFFSSFFSPDGGPPALGLGKSSTSSVSVSLPRLTINLVLSPIFNLPMAAM